MRKGYPGITARLFCAILSCCLLLLIIMHWGGRLSFEKGFINYIRDSNQQRAVLLSDALAEQYTQHGDWRFLKHDQRLLFRLMRNSDRQPDPSGLPPHGWRAPIWVTDAQLRVLAGPPAPPPPQAFRQPVRVQHQVVGWVFSAPTDRLTQRADINFARQQSRTSWLMMALTTLLAAIVTWRLSRSFLAPVKRLAAATHQLASGDFAARVQVSGRDELSRLASDFNQLARTLEKNEKMRRALMADISHELRTPLAVLHGELEALQDGVRPLTPASLSSLQAEVGTLTKLVDDLYQLSLSDVGALTYRKRAVDVTALLHQAFSVFQERFHARQIHTELTLPERAVVFGDPDRLMQLFNNLFENSLRYTDPGGRLTVSGLRQGTTLRLTWQDSAPGVSDEQLDRIFDRFYRAEASRNRASGGAGLGLAICQNIVDAHEGQLRAAHSPFGGVAITVLLPLSAE